MDLVKLKFEKFIEFLVENTLFIVKSEKKQEKTGQAEIQDKIV